MYLGRVNTHLGRVNIHLGRVNIHLGRVNMYLGRVNIHLDRVNTHLALQRPLQRRLVLLQPRPQRLELGQRLLSEFSNDVNVLSVLFTLTKELGGSRVGSGVTTRVARRTAEGRGQHEGGSTAAAGGEARRHCKAH
jgi:hypothetical protein